MGKTWNADVIIIAHQTNELLPAIAWIHLWQIHSVTNLNFSSDIDPIGKRPNCT